MIDLIETQIDIKTLDLGEKTKDSILTLHDLRNEEVEHTVCQVTFSIG